MLKTEVATSGQAEITFSSEPSLLSPDDVLSLGDQAPQWQRGTSTIAKYSNLAGLINPGWLTIGHWWWINHRLFTVNKKWLIIHQSINDQFKNGCLLIKSINRKNDSPSIKMVDHWCFYQANQATIQTMQNIRRWFPDSEGELHGREQCPWEVHRRWRGIPARCLGDRTIENMCFFFSGNNFGIYMYIYIYIPYVCCLSSPTMNHWPTELQPWWLWPCSTLRTWRWKVDRPWRGESWWRPGGCLDLQVFQTPGWLGWVS